MRFFLYLKSVSPIQLLLNITFLSLLLILSPARALGADPEHKGPAKKIRAENREPGRDALRERDKAIESLQRRVELLEQEIRALRQGPIPSAVPSADQRAGTSAEPKRTSAADPTPSSPAKPAAPLTPEEREEEERLARSALEQVLIGRNAVLLPKWTLEIEPSITYAHSSFDVVNINGVVILVDAVPFLALGDILSSRIKRDSLISTLSFRLGLPWDSQVEARLPYRYDSEHTVIADTLSRTRSNSGIGDFEFALSKQLMQEKGWIPDLIGGVRWRAPTAETTKPPALGFGTHGVQFLLSTVKLREPVAFFGGLNYTANFADNVNGFDLEPGDTMGFNMGLAVALNPETSINFQWDERFTGHSKINGENALGSSTRLGVFRVGLTYALARDYFVDIGVGIGITSDTPDVQGTISFPFRIPSIFKE